ncbi:MAG: ABC transporter permease [bacterium]|nr:ABC transporter permease [bacterium]
MNNLKNKGHTDIRRIIPVYKKEFLHILRDPRSLGFVLLLPVVMLVLYSYAVTFDIKRIDIGVVDHDRSRMSRDLKKKFVSSDYFTVFSGKKTETINDMDTAVKNLKQNRIRLILAIPRNFSGDIKKNKNVNIQVLIDGSDANTASVALGYAGIIVSQFSRKILLSKVRQRGFDPRNIPVIEPIPRVWYNPELKSTNFIVPGLISVIMMLIAGLLTSLTVVREKERGTFEQLISTPVKPLELMVGKLLPYIVIALCDVAIIVTVGILWFKVPFRGNFIVLFFFSILFLFCALGLGLFISSIVKTQQMAVLATVMTTLLPSILLSGFVFPIDSMPWVVRLVTYAVPTRYFLTGLRSIFLKEGGSVFVLLNESLYLIFFGSVFLFISSKKFKKTLE